jgi:hypothetical protein
VHDIACTRANGPTDGGTTGNASTGYDGSDGANAGTNGTAAEHLLIPVTQSTACGQSQCTGNDKNCGCLSHLSYPFAFARLRWSFTDLFDEQQLAKENGKQFGRIGGGLGQLCR